MASESKVVIFGYKFSQSALPQLKQLENSSYLSGVLKISAYPSSHGPGPFPLQCCRLQKPGMTFNILGFALVNECTLLYHLLKVDSVSNTPSLSVIFRVMRYG